MPLEFAHWFAVLLLPRAAWLTPRCGLWGSLQPGAAQAMQYQPLEGTRLHLGPNQSCCYSRDKFWAQRHPLSVPSSHTYTAGAATMAISTQATDAEVQKPWTGQSHLSASCLGTSRHRVLVGTLWGANPNCCPLFRVQPSAYSRVPVDRPHLSLLLWLISSFTSFPAKQHPTIKPLTDLPFPQSHSSLPPESQPSSKRTSLLTPRGFQLEGTALSFVTHARERARGARSTDAAWRKRAAVPGPDPQ